MKHAYDSWKICASRMKRKLVFCSEAQPNLRVANRVLKITYPDGEVVNYEYGMGGMPKRRLCMGIAKRIEFRMPHNPSSHPRITASPPIVHCSLSIVHSPSARHRHSGFAGTSDLSIWLSVDPMADKYPGVSPYTYCANNPVKLVDPDGREWLDPEKDGKIAGELIYRAKQAICRHEKSIQKFQKWADKATDPKQKNDLEKGIADHKQRIDLLTEAIAGITEMGNKEGVYFHYNVNAKRTTHNVQLIRANDDNKHDYISINVKDSYIIQMHETVHAFDYMQGKYCLEFSNNGLLGSRYYHDESEIHAYQVEYSLSSTKERFPNIVHVQDINKKTIKSIEDAAPNSP